MSKIAAGFNTLKSVTRTGLLCVDLSKAFDAVDCLEKVDRRNLHPHLKQWLVYWRDWKLRLFQGARSRWRKMVGISPSLFNFFRNDISASVTSANESYADNFHAASHHTSASVIAEELSGAAAEIAAQATAHGMSLSATKSMVTLFTPWNKQYGCLPEVKLGDAIIPQANNPKLLGVVFTFCAHATATARKASR